MKKALITLLQFCLLYSISFIELHAQNCTFSTDQRLNSQAAVNEYGVNKSSCKNIKGNITISGADITNLSPLSNIETIDGMFTIQSNTTLTSLHGLEKLTGVKNLLIYYNHALTDLSGLEGLLAVSGSTHIRYNNGLTSLKGLDNLTSVNLFYLTNNDLLASLSGLGKLESASDILSINTNKSLLSLTGLTSLTSVSRILIGENELLTDLTGLESLTSVSWQINVSSNKKLTSLNGLTNLTYLSEIYVTDNNLMTDMTGLESVGGVKWMVVGESNGLTSLNGLNNLTSATNLIIRNNPLLNDLTGLENLTNIGWMQITGNGGLTSLTGMGLGREGGRTGANERTSATMVSRLSIIDNPKLTTCAIAPICSFLKDNTAVISGNSTGCQSESAIELSCGSLPVTLVHFTAVSENKTALLQWTTAEESNSSVFEIEHSVDTKTWKKAGEQAAKGQSNEAVNYQWVHNTPSAGLNYYRLKMIDLDGTYAYSRIEKLSFNSLAAYIYPNPVSDMLFVEDKNGITSLKIVDLQGKTIFETNSVPQEGLSVKKLAKGLYQIRITRRGGTVETERVAIL